jgi:hypothetical protein
MPRLAIPEFQLARPLYKGASVTFYTVAAGAKTNTKATLYQASSGSDVLANPQKLDSYGKFKQPVYIDVPVIGAVEGITVPSHDTGIVSPAPTFRVSSAGVVQYSFDGGVTWESSGDYFFRDRGTWAGATAYERNDMVVNQSLRYIALSEHTSTASFATDLADGKWRLMQTGQPAVITSIADLKALTGSSLTGQALVLGYYSSGDGGGGLYRWDSASTDADNLGTIIAPNAGGTGRWKLIHQGTVSVKQFGAKGDGATDDKAAIQAAWDSISSTGPGVVELPRGTYQCNSALSLPNSDYATIRGVNRTSTTINMAAGFGISSNGTTRRFGLQLSDLTIQASALNAAVALDLNDLDRSSFTNLRVINFATGVKVTADAAGGAYHNIFINPRITNCTTGMQFTGANGSNQSHVYGGEISSNTTGLLVDNPTDGCEVLGTSFESNAQAISCNGKRNIFLNVRFEGNTADMAFGANSSYNLLRTAFFDDAKHSDASTVNANYVELHGFTVSATETKEVLESFDARLIDDSVIAEAANRGYYLEVIPKRLFRATKIMVTPTVSPGGINIDVGIASFGGTVLTSSGSTALGAINTVQELTLTTPIWMLPGRRYYLIIAFDSVAGGPAVAGSVPSTPGAVCARKDSKAGHKDTVFPLAGTSSSGLSTPTRLPWLRAA